MFSNCANDNDGGGDLPKHESIELSKDLSQAAISQKLPSNTGTCNQQQVSINNTKNIFCGSSNI